MKSSSLRWLTWVGCCVGIALNGQAWGNSCAMTTPESVSGTVGGSGDCESWGMWGCPVAGGTGSCSASSDGRSFTVQSTKNANGTVDWQLVQSSEGFAGLDLAVWVGTKKGQNSPHIWSYDVEAAVGMSCSSAPSTIYFCSDGKDEVQVVDTENAGTPAVGALCGGEDVVGGQFANIFGVLVNVSSVNPYQGDTTIAVARSNRPCGRSEQPKCVPDTQGFRLTDPTGQVWEPDPYFGFINPADGQVTLENVCVAGLPKANDVPAQGDSVAFQARPQCDPDKTVDNGPNTDSLPECENRLKGIVREEVSVGFEGSGYVRGGGTIRYY